MDLSDRMARGFIAGVFAGAIQDAVDYLSYALNINDLRYIDWVAIIIFNHKPTSISETALAAGGELFFSGILGVVFAYLIPKVTSKNFLFKGWVYGVLVWFALYSIMELFKVKGLTAINVSSAASDVVTSSIYGLLLAVSLIWLDKKVRV
ncbi:MAG: hypothetical protein AB1500_07325 [Bacillota bacterium]